MDTVELKECSKISDPNSIYKIQMKNGKIIELIPSSWLPIHCTDSLITGLHSDGSTDPIYTRDVELIVTKKIDKLSTATVIVLVVLGTVYIISIIMWKTSDTKMTMTFGPGSW